MDFRAENGLPLRYDGPPINWLFVLTRQACRGSFLAAALLDGAADRPGRRWISNEGEEALRKPRERSICFWRGVAHLAKYAAVAFRVVIVNEIFLALTFLWL